jgi:hypothetical protein
VEVYTSLARIDDGHMGAVHQCEREDSSRSDTFVVLDVSTGRTDVLAPGPAYPADFPSSVAWDAGRPVAFQSGDALCGTIYRLDPAPIPLDVMVTVGGESFSIGVDVAGTQDRCPEHGRAGRPAVQGDRLAFYASENGAEAGQGVLDRPWHLLVSDGGRAPRRVLGDVLDPGDQVWSADGNRLFSLGTRAGQAGAWEIDTSTGQATLWVNGDFTRISLSPSENRLVALSPGGPEVAAGTR